MGNTYFTSDLHFGHNKEFVYAARGFESIEQHDTAIINNWNNTVTDDDDIYLLGDVMLKDVEYGMERLKQLKGRIHIIRGNHDTDEKIKLYVEVPNVVELVDAKYLRVGKKTLYLSHFPTMVAHDNLKTMKHAVINLYGHTHQNDDFYKLNGEYHPYMYHVGMDSHNMQLVEMEDILEEVKRQKEKYELAHGANVVDKRDYMLTVFYNHVQEAMQQEKMTLEEVAAKITEHGICGLEFDYYDLIKNGHFDRELADKVRKLGIPVIGAYVMFDWGRKFWDTSYKQVYKNLQSIGVKYSLAIPGMVPDGKNTTLYKKRMAKRLRKAVEYAKECGIKVLMEDFDNYHAPFSTSDGMLYFMENVPGLKIAFDTGNFYYSDEDAWEVLPKFINDTEYVHCKDRSLVAKPGEEPLKSISGVDLYSSAVGEGVIPMKDIVMKLKNHGYKGVYAIEHFGSKTQLRDMIASADYLNEILK